MDLLNAKDCILIGMFLNESGRVIGRVLCVIFEKKNETAKRLGFLIFEIPKQHFRC